MTSARETGRKLLAKTLGDDYLKRRDEGTNAFNGPLREFSETAAFGMVWSRDHRGDAGGGRGHGGEGRHALPR